MTSERHPPRAQWDHSEPHPVQIVCGVCGSADVRRDAWAEWDVELQKWVLGAVFDDGHCEVCEGSQRLEEEKLDEWLGDKSDDEAIPGGFNIPTDYSIDAFETDAGFGARVYRDGITVWESSPSNYLDVMSAKDAARHAIVHWEIDE